MREGGVKRGRIQRERERRRYMDGMRESGRVWEKGEKEGGSRGTERRERSMYQREETDYKLREDMGKG